MEKAPKAKCNECTLIDNSFVATKPNSSKIILLAEAPGWYEVKGKEYMIGTAGHQLEEVLGEINYRKSDFNILNACCCRPTNGDRNRTPTLDEIRCCNERLAEEIKNINPDKIICLGKMAYISLGGNPNMKMWNIVGTSFNYNSIPCNITWHPAAILHSGGVSSERGGKVYEDMKKHFKKFITTQQQSSIGKQFDFLWIIDGK